MKVKVCGLRDPENIEQINALQPDFLGFIFYEKSKRLIDNNTKEFLKTFETQSKKVGVFVNEKVENVQEIIQELNLDYAQLHGHETAYDVATLNKMGIKIIKAFSIDVQFNWNTISAYKPYVDYFLFDTATKNFGGSGLQFDWSLLKNYKEDLPFLLSGGIGENDALAIQQLNLKNLLGVDINSRFEIAPGVKNIKSIQQFLNQIRNEQV